MYYCIKSILSHGCIQHTGWFLISALKTFPRKFVVTQNNEKLFSSEMDYDSFEPHEQIFLSNESIGDISQNQENVCLLVITDSLINRVLRTKILGLVATAIPAFAWRYLHDKLSIRILTFPDIDITWFR